MTIRQVIDELRALQADTLALAPLSVQEAEEMWVTLLWLAKQLDDTLAVAQRARDITFKILIDRQLQ